MIVDRLHKRSPSSPSLIPVSHVPAANDLLSFVLLLLVLADEMANANDEAVVFDKSSNLDNEDIWDDSLLTEAYSKQQRMVEKALREKRDGKTDDPENGSIHSDTRSCHSSSKVRKVICEPPLIPCDTVTPKSSLFAVGDACRCTYSADGVEYEADIVELFEDKNQCLVRYVGYENEELRAIPSLFPSHGKDARVKQTKESQSAVNTEDLLQMPSSPEPDITPVSGRSEVKKVISRIAEQEKSKEDQQTAYKKKGRLAKDRLTNESIILPYRKLDTKANPVTNSPPKPSSSFPTSFMQQSQSSVCPPPLPPGLLSGRSDEDDALASMLMSWYMSGYHTGYYEAMKKYNK